MNDVHIIATAVAAQANSIVTYNALHFPDQVLVPLGLRTETPDELCARLFTENQIDVIEGARMHRASLKRPAYDAGSYLDHLGSLGFKRIANLLRMHQNAV